MHKVFELLDQSVPLSSPEKGYQEVASNIESNTSNDTKELSRLVIHCMFLVIRLVTLVAVVMLLSIILNDKLKDNQIILVDEEWNDVGIKSGHFFWTLLFKTALGHYPTSPCSTPLWLSNLLDNT